jgi:hypothetical protein
MDKLHPHSAEGASGGGGDSPTVSSLARAAKTQDRVIARYCLMLSSFPTTSWATMASR